MTHRVFITASAIRDLDDILDYIASHDDPEIAGRVLSQLEAAIAGLSSSPLRGAYPKELLALGIREFRQIVLGLYRIIYRVISKRVYVLLVADGRRDMQTLLQQRVLRP